MSSPNALSLSNPEQHSKQPRISKAIGGLALRLHNKEKAEKEKEAIESSHIHDGIIKYLYSDYSTFLNSENPNLLDAERQIVFDKIRSGEIDLDYASDTIFESIAGPMKNDHNLEDLYNSILNNTNMSSIFFYATDPKTVEKADDTEAEISKTIARIFPNPQESQEYIEAVKENVKNDMAKISYHNEHSMVTFARVYHNPKIFEPVGDAFLGSIKNDKNPLVRLQYKQYKKDMKKFKQLVYGRQQKYWDQIRIIEKEALDSSKEN